MNSKLYQFSAIQRKYKKKSAILQDGNIFPRIHLFPCLLKTSH